MRWEIKQAKKGFVNQVAFGHNFTCSENLLKCSEQRIYRVLFTLFFFFYTFLNDCFCCVEYDSACFNRQQIGLRVEADRARS